MPTRSARGWVIWGRPSHIGRCVVRVSSINSCDVHRILIAISAQLERTTLKLLYSIRVEYRTPLNQTSHKTFFLFRYPNCKLARDPLTARKRGECKSGSSLFSRLRKRRFQRDLVTKNELDAGAVDAEPI